MVLTETIHIRMSLPLLSAQDLKNRISLSFSVEAAIIFACHKGGLLLFFKEQIAIFIVTNSSQSASTKKKYKIPEKFSERDNKSEIIVLQMSVK